MLGTTLTTSSRDGALLLSFVAAFVALVGSQLWRSVSFLIHQKLAVRTPSPGIHYQRQNILRNTASPIGAAWSLLLLAWHWRRIDRRGAIKALPLALLACAYFLAFALLAVFSSQVARGLSTARLLLDLDCGIWLDAPFGQEQSNDTRSQGLRNYRRKMTYDTLRASTYSRACYTDRISSLDCGTFPQPALPSIVETNVTCPFPDNSLCLDGRTIRLDTGILDSHDHLGINAPLKNRIGFRKETVCTPLPTGEKYTSFVTGEDAVYFGFEDNTLIRYEYGPTVVGNYSFLYNTLSGDVLVAYSLTTLSNVGSWQPIPGLVRDDADLSVIFVAVNAVRFSEPNSDPVFGANIEHLNPETGALMWYDSDRYVSPIACIDRYQFCEPSGGSCTDLVGHTQLDSAARSSLDFNVFQHATAQRLFLLAPFLSIREAIWTRNTNALRAQDTLTDLDQGALAANQWELEVSGWFTDGLARLQHLVQGYPNLRGAGTAEVGYVYRVWEELGPQSSAIDVANGLAHKSMCGNQVINDSQTTMSFSVIGLAVVFALGGAIVFTSLILETVVSFVQKRLRKGLVARDTWIQDDKLNMQMRLFESAGLGKWKYRTATVPITVSNETLDAWTVLVDSNIQQQESEETGKPTVTSSLPLISDAPVESKQPDSTLVAMPRGPGMTQEVGRGGEAT